MSTGATAQDSSWKNKARGDEDRYAKAREQDQLKELRKKLDADSATRNAAPPDAAAVNPANPTDTSDQRRADIEGGFGGQEDLEDRYATTSGEH